jgi:predicted GNAT superfamily acetyltransferase
VGFARRVPLSKRHPQRRICGGDVAGGARRGKTAGFLFGFYTFDGAPLPADWTERFNGGFRIESQTLGVLPDYRGLRIANLLKKRQAELAWREGVGVVSWTADPLQAPNAALNFGLLKAVAFEFAPDLYPFRNELNRVHASRFGLTWLVGSKRVRDTPPSVHAPTSSTWRDARKFPAPTTAATTPASILMPT